MINKTPFERRRLKFVATINDEALTETTDPDHELTYVDIGNVDSLGRITGTERLRFVSAPSRARRIARNGDVIISTVRTYLQAIAPIVEAPDDLIVSTGFAVVRPLPHVLDAGFCKYAFRDTHFLWEVESRSTGVSYPAINASELGDIEIALPPMDEQRRIAAWLDAETAHIDALVAEKERMLTLLAERRAARISRVVIRGLDPATALRPSGLDWLGNIPAHWDMQRLKFQAAAPLAYGANEPGTEADLNHPRFVRITDIAEDGSLRDDTYRSLDPEVAAPYLLQEGDVLFARSGATVGKAFLYREDWGTACFAGYLIRFRCNPNRLLPAYLYHYATSAPYWYQIESGSIQATIQNFSAEKYGDLVIPLPPLREQADILRRIEEDNDHTRRVTVETQRTLTLLAERRRALISAAVTGRATAPVLTP